MAYGKRRAGLGLFVFSVSLGMACWAYQGVRDGTGLLLSTPALAAESSDLFAPISVVLLQFFSQAPYTHRHPAKAGPVQVSVIPRSMILDGSRPSARSAATPRRRDDGS